MDLSQQLHSLASDVGNDYAMSAPEDASRLIGKARRGRMVWTSGVGAVAAAGAATLAFGGPAVAAALSGNTQLEPASPASESASTSAEPSVTPSPSPEPSVSPSATTAGAGVIDLSGGVTGGDDDDAYDDSSDDAYDDSSDDSYDDDSEDSVETHSEDAVETHSDDSSDDSSDD